MSLANHARSGSGKVSKAGKARGTVEKQFSVTPQGSTPSNIPQAGPQGVPSAEVDQMAAFARGGNSEMIPKAVAAMTGEISVGPKVAALVARMGGQVGLSPGQIKVWANPQDAAPKVSDQVTSDASKPGSLPTPQGPVVPQA